MKKHPLMLFVFFFTFFLFVLTSKSYAFFYQVKIGYKNVDENYITSHYKLVIDKIYSNLKIIDATATTDEIDNLKNDPNITFVDYNQNIPLQLQTVDMIKKTSLIINPLNINNNSYSLIKLSQAYTKGITGKGIKICVIDTGVDYTHPLLKGKIAPYPYSHSFIEDNNGNYIEDPSDYMDYEGHGTHVAGIIVGQNSTIGLDGIARDATLYVQRVFDKSGVGDGDVLAAINNCINDKVNIISMSLGWGTGSTDPTPSIHSAMDTAFQDGIINVVAAGNSFEDSVTNGGCGGSTANDCVSYPARYSSAVAVGSSDDTGNISSFSSQGPALYITAPGGVGDSQGYCVNGILSTYPVNLDINDGVQDGYTEMCGTSMATPAVSGTIALLEQLNPQLTNQQILNLLTSTALHEGTTGRNTTYGYGIIQEPTVKYPDVFPNYWAYNSINDVSNQGWMLGGTNGYFNPLNQMTRAEVATALSRLITNTSGVSTNSSFSDVDTAAWFYHPISIMSNLGMMNGTGTTTFSPTKNITREEVATILDRLLKETNYTGPSMFSDVNDPSRFSYQSILNMGNNKYILGCQTNLFCPTNQITRAEVATLLDRVGTLIQQKN